MHSLKSVITLWGLLFIVSFVAASSHQQKGQMGLYNFLAARQDDEETKTTEAAETETETGTAEATATGTAESEEPTETGTATGKETGSDKTESGESETEKPTPTSVDPRAPPGGIELVTPGRFAPDTYIKIGESATFAWNYTSLIITPTAVDVIAYCSRNDHTYTIAGNESVKETGKVVWDTGKADDGEVPLLTEMYTLMVYDSDSSPSDVPEPGHLGAMSQHTFGVYKKQEYTPGFKCQTCNSATSDMNRQACFFMFTMMTITVASFTFFASGFGVFS